ncbi:MAG TPA: hypothetical protein VN867_04350 [Candidatus Binataceae bacterium]|nr:hypothetical protein [Candidatus Binataceae bacterium]
MMLFSWRMLVLFIHVASVIVALGGSLFSTFALTPILGQELEPGARVKVARRVIRRLGTIVLSALAILIVTGIVNVMYMGVVTTLLAIKLFLVTIVIVLALYQYGSIGARIWRYSAKGPDPMVGPLQVRFRAIGLTVGALVLIIVYLSLALSRGGGPSIPIPDLG